MLGDDLAAALPLLQAEAESRMNLPCLIERVTATTADTGVTVEAATRIWAGCCELQDAGGESLVQAGDAPVTKGSRIVKIPVGVAGVQEGDRITIGDRRFRVGDLHRKSWQTCQRLPVTELL